MIEFSEKDGELIFSVKVVLRAAKSEIVGAAADGALKIRIASPPVEGAANAELVKLLSKSFGVSKTKVEIIGGQTSRNKKIRIGGAGPEKLAAILQAKKQRDILPFSSNPKN